ncbi:hypothetical protein GWI33_022123 [Rhynchophorus ferrugineus]|uniref:Uncharacterized protein n=1 Tax=Rhynchophorus ferrugineus TaxID=354439 RepID=A0A834IP26_RHYFE|nr:hypothetical protein GWI33_022123 [Rhynchophorus ferrugineus]
MKRTRNIRKEELSRVRFWTERNVCVSVEVDGPECYVLTGIRTSSVEDKKEFLPLRLSLASRSREWYR